MSEQVLIQFRADKELKQDVAEIYESMGLDLPTAFRMFMYRTKAVNGLPLNENAATRIVFNAILDGTLIPLFHEDILN